MAIATVGTGGRDFVDLFAWLASLPASFTEDETAVLYNDSEFVSASQISIDGFVDNGFKLIIKCADGESFQDSSSGPLRYDPSQGVAIRKTTGYNRVIYAYQDNVELHGLQLEGTQCDAVFMRSENSLIKDCLALAGGGLCMDIRVGTCTMVNTTVVSTHLTANPMAVRYSYCTGAIVNCLFYTVDTNHAGYGLTKQGGVADTLHVNSSAFIGFAHAGPPAIYGVGSGYNATDVNLCYIGLNNTVGVVPADSFVDTNPASLDLRVKSGSVLAGAGQTQTAYTADKDVYNFARAEPPTIGPTELISAASGATASVSFEVIKPSFSANIAATITPKADVNTSIAKPVFSGLVEVTLPTPVGFVDFEVASPTFDAAILATLPSPELDSSFEVPSPVFTAVIGVTLPNPVSVVGFVAPRPQFSATLEATVPNPQLGVSLVLPRPQFSATLEATVPNPQLGVSLVLPSPSFSAEVSATFPSPETVVAFSLPPPEFSTEVLITEAGNSLSAAFEIAKPEFLAGIGVTLPQPSGEINFTIPKPTFRVHHRIGKVEIEVTPEGTIEVPYSLNSLICTYGLNSIELPYYNNLIIIP